MKINKKIKNFYTLFLLSLINSSPNISHCGGDEEKETTTLPSIIGDVVKSVGHGTRDVPQFPAQEGTNAATESTRIAIFPGYYDKWRCNNTFDIMQKLILSNKDYSNEQKTAKLLELQQQRHRYCNVNNPTAEIMLQKQTTAATQPGAPSIIPGPVPDQNSRWCLICSVSEKNDYSFLDYFLFSFGSCWLLFIVVLNCFIFFKFIKNFYFKEYLTSTFSYGVVLKSLDFDFKFWFFLLFSFLVTSFFFAGFINIKQNILAASMQGILDGRDVLENRFQVLIGNQKEIARALEIIFVEIQAPKIEPNPDSDYITFPEEGTE